MFVLNVWSSRIHWHWSECCRCSSGYSLGMFLCAARFEATPAPGLFAEGEVSGALCCTLKPTRTHACRLTKS